MHRILFIAVLLVPSAMAQEPVEVPDPQQGAAHNFEQFTFEIRFLSGSEELIEQIPKECLTEISMPKQREPFQDWETQKSFDNVGTDAVFISQPTWHIRPIEITRVATLDDEQMGRLIQSAQNDSRSNIMSAPKVTVFRDQVGTIEDCVRTPLQPNVENGASPKDELLNGTQVYIRVTSKEDGAFWADSEVLLHSIDSAQQTNQSEQASKTPTRQMTNTYRLSHQVNGENRTVVIIPPRSQPAVEPPKPKIRLAGFRKPVPVRPGRMLIAIKVREAFVETSNRDESSAP